MVIALLKIITIIMILLEKRAMLMNFYLTDDSSGLFRNAFYTEPRTYGVSLQKRF